LGAENLDLPSFVSISPASGHGGPRNYGCAFLPAAHQATKIGHSGKLGDGKIPYLDNSHLSASERTSNLPGAPAPASPYSHVAQCGEWLFLAGQVASDLLADGETPPTDVAGQTHAVLRSLERILAAHGAGLRDVVSVRVFLSDFEADFEAMNAAYAAHFPEDHRPPRTCVGVTAMADGMRVEIDLVAHKPR